MEPASPHVDAGIQGYRGHRIREHAPKSRISPTATPAVPVSLDEVGSRRKPHQVQVHVRVERAIGSSKRVFSFGMVAS
jgi:hypothetical protein